MNANADTACLLFPQAIDTACRAVVIIPVRNEEASLLRTLESLACQVDRTRTPLAFSTYEILLFLNNCRDASGAIAAKFAGAHPEVRIFTDEQWLMPEDAHIGTARRLLMNAACERLESLGSCEGAAILSTDADTVVSPDWVAQNLYEIQQGADAVGGAIQILPDELADLDAHTRLAYERDLTLQRLCAQLECILDPVLFDPWPRHAQNFGASLACTPAAYRRCGGLPSVRVLEDVALVEALRATHARIRHSPAVRVFTSARLLGRTEVGLSGQLRAWGEQAASGEPQLVDSCAWTVHVCRTGAACRKGAISAQNWTLHAQETFRGTARFDEITRVMAEMRAAIEVELACTSAAELAPMLILPTPAEVALSGVRAPGLWVTSAT